MKKLFLFFIMGMFMISCVNAITWDNTAYLKLEEAAGTFEDATSNNNDGIAAGDLPTQIAGKIDFGQDLDGTGDYINMTDIMDTGVFTANVWYNPDATTYTNRPISKNIPGSSGFRVLERDDGTLWFEIQDDGSEYQIQTTDKLSVGGWNMITILRRANGTAEIYINGTQSGHYDATTYATNDIDLTFGGIATGGVNGQMDEIGIWDRDLSATEISELWNLGSGTPFVNPIPGVITLEYPTNTTTISDVGANFTVSGDNISSLSATWDNITYYVWQNVTLLNESTVALSGEVFNETLFIDNFTLGNYLWSADACYTNITGSYCINASYNNTFSVSLYSLASEGYATETISGTLEVFNLSIDLLPGFELTGATFYYEGIIETPTITAEDDNRFVLISDYAIPISNIDVNNSFYWELEFNDVIIENTTNRTQLVRAVMLDNCDSYSNRIFNISLFDEQTKNTLNGDIELIYNVLNTNYEIVKTYNFSASSVNNTYVCSSIDLSEENLYYSAEMRYYADGYASELYNIQRAEIVEGGASIDLYDLNSSEATQFKITYQDSNFNFVEGAIIQLQRKYISEGIYETVEAPLTSAEGIALVSIDLDSIKYRATVVKNGVVLDEFDNLVFKCQSELTGECDYKLLGEIDPQNEVDLSNILDFYYTEPTISNNTITVSFSIPSGTPSVINLVLEQKDEFGNETLCNRTITSSAGSISCTYSESLGDSYIDLYLSKNGVTLVRKSYILNAEKSLDWLGNNYVFILVLLLSLVGMALSSPEWIIINGIITMVISGGLYLASGLDFVTGLGTIMWLVIAAVIIISKMSKQEDR